VGVDGKNATGTAILKRKIKEEEAWIGEKG